MTAPELLYVGDPMCSWCWGFAPVLEGLRDGLGMAVRVKVGGLRTGPSADQLDARMARFLAGCWRQVHEASGQPFDHRILDDLRSRPQWRYNTELPCRAVVAVRQRAPEKALAFSTRLHRAFYAEGIDITDPAHYPALAEGFIAPDQLTEALADPTVAAITRADFAWALQHDIRAFPTLLIAPEGLENPASDLVLVTQGYRPLGVLLPAIRRWMTRQGMPVPGDGAGCLVGEECG